MDIKYIPCKKPNICKSCGSEFPNWIEVDGKRRNLRARSYCLDCSPLDSHNSKRLSKYRKIDGIEHKFCPQCQNWKPTNEYHHSKARNGKRYICNAWCKGCSNARSKLLAAKIKRKSIEYKGGECQDCHKSFPDYIYDFHHLDPERKDFKLSFYTVRRMDWKTIAEELDKCVLLCAHCHRHRHYDKSNSNYCPTRSSSPSVGRSGIR